MKIRAGQQHWLMCHRAVMQIWVNKVQTVWGFNLHFNNHFIWSNPIQHLSNRCWSLGSPVPPLSLSLCNLSQKVMCCSTPLTYRPPPYDSKVFLVIYSVWHVSRTLSFIILFPSAVQFGRCGKKTLKNKPNVPDHPLQSSGSFPTAENNWKLFNLH